jgi:enoyl-CoA hydratase
MVPKQSGGSEYACFPVRREISLPEETPVRAKIVADGFVYFFASDWGWKEDGSIFLQDGKEGGNVNYQNLIYDKDNRIVRLTLNRPEKMNALNTPLMNELKSALEEAERDQDVRVIIIKGAGRTFSAGYDLTPPAPGQEPAPLPIELQNKYHIGRNHGVWFTIWNLLKPVIAQVHGYCLAGASELAFMCDITIMAEDAVTGYPPVRSFSTPDTLFHPWLGGMKKAKLMLFTGDTITGKEAAECGMASMAVPADKLEEVTNQIAARVALIPTDLISLIKGAINHT